MATYTAVYAKDEDWIIGWVLELPGAIVQERTLEQARTSMREVIPLILDTRSGADDDTVQRIRDSRSEADEDADIIARETIEI
jgi:predicted RNase H-like HicB family nuclease